MEHQPAVTAVQPDAVSIIRHALYDGCGLRRDVPIDQEEGRANAMVPQHVEWRESLPRNPNGKYDRAKLAAELKAQFAQETK